jgi:hypothetical protein
MYENRDDILEDIYLLEPSLKERDGEVRPIIEALISAHPQAEASDAFVATLRAQLVPRHEFQKQRIHHSVNWWFVHLMPVGAIAVLTLMLVPNLMGPDMYKNTPTETSSLALEMAPEPLARSMGAADDASLMQVATDMVPPTDSFTVSDQLPGDVAAVDLVTLSLPGFVTLHSNDEGELGDVVGTSTLLGIGTSERIIVSLSRTMAEGETYYVALFHDNGDGVFTLATDAPVIEPTLGVPIYMLITVRELGNISPIDE